MDNLNSKFTLREKILAWSVHIFTASGIVFAFLALLAANRHDWRSAVLWLFVCLLIDGADGTFARRFRVTEVLPFMDGKMIDAVIDFITYAFLPAYIFYEAGLASPGWGLPCAGAMLLAGALYYGKEGMISEDYRFVGFPVLWNVYVFYALFVFTLPLWVNTFLVFVFAILHFVPLRFAYPSRMGRYQSLSIGISILAFIATVWIIWVYPARNPIANTMAIIAAVYFMGLALWETKGKKTEKPKN